MTRKPPSDDGRALARPIPHPWIDSSRAPLYVWTLRDDPTSSVVAACLAAREQWSEGTQEPVAWVVDLTQLSSVNAIQRKMFATHLERFRPFDEKWTAASAIVASSPWLRGLVTAVFWLSPPKFPNRVFADVESARTWAERELGARGQKNVAPQLPRA
jgi:hypothetical protein